MRPYHLTSPRGCGRSGRQNRGAGGAAQGPCCKSIREPGAAPLKPSILTCRYPHNHGVFSGDSAPSLNPTTLIQRHLKSVGYSTAMVGKYFRNWDLRSRPPGFDRWALCWPCRYFNPTFSVNGTIRSPGRYLTDYIASWSRRALATFERRDNAPWFLYVAPVAPHKPAIAEPDFKTARVVGMATRRCSRRIGETSPRMSNAGGSRSRKPTGYAGVS